MELTPLTIPRVDRSTLTVASLTDEPDDLDGILVNLISLRHLKINKRASGRYKDLNDLENLP